MKKIIKLIFCFIIIFNMLSCDTSRKGEQFMNSIKNKNLLENKNNIEEIKISLEIEGTKLTVSMINSKATQDFLALLPLTITMKDLYASEKYAELPIMLSKEGISRQGYNIGDIGYWAPGNCLVIYYKQTGEIINDLQIIGKVDKNIEFFEEYKGDVIVKISKLE